MKNKKIHNIFQPTAQQLVDSCSGKEKVNWKELYEKLDKQIAKDMKAGEWKQWK
jgi:hypothetical protein